MRHLRRLPPLLRVLMMLGFLFPLASLVLVCISWLSYQSHPSVELSRLYVIALNLGILGGACTLVVGAYGKRFNQPVLHVRMPRLNALNSWPGQLRAIGLLGALPLSAIILAAIIPPEVTAFEIVFPLSIVAAFVLLGANVARVAASQL